MADHRQMLLIITVLAVSLAALIAGVVTNVCMLERLESIDDQLVATTELDDRSQQALPQDPSEAAQPETTEQKPRRICLITHEQPGDHEF